MRDYINETKIELVKRLTDIEIEIKKTNIKVSQLAMTNTPTILLELPEYRQLVKLRKDRDKLNSTLDLIEVLDV